MGQVQTEVRFICPECSEKVAVIVYVPEVDWSHDSPGDSLSEDDIDIECPLCETVFDAHVQNSPSHCAVEFSEYPDVEVEADDAIFSFEHDDDEHGWLNLDPPDEPFAVYKDAIYRLQLIIGEHGIGGKKSILQSSAVVNRMVYASAIGAMEAFLGDLLMRTVLAEKIALKRLLANESELKKTSISLVRIYENPNVVTDHVREYLAGIQYHNLSKIAKLYELALDIEVFPSKEIRSALSRSVTIRHDLVHRNGKTKTGDPIELPTSTVENLINDLMTFGIHVYKEVLHALTYLEFQDLTLTEGKQ